MGWSMGAEFQNVQNSFGKMIFSIFFFVLEKFEKFKLFKGILRTNEISKFTKNIYEHPTFSKNKKNDLKFWVAAFAVKPPPPLHQVSNNSRIVVWAMLSN